MLRKLTIVILAGVVFCGIFASNMVAETFEKLTPQKIPLDQIVPSSPTPLTGDKGFCLIQSDDNNVVSFFGDFHAGDGFALYMDPAQCGLPDPYPFKITDVHFYLYSPEGYIWPVQIQVIIRDLDRGEKCNGPGDSLCSQIYTIDSLSAHPNLIQLDLDSLCCVYSPFFLEIIYTGQTDPPYPSLVMTDESTNPADTCDAWVWYFDEGQHWYFEWYNFWGEPPGYPVMRITGYTQQCHPESCWYWKDSTENSPSGMPDFDQNQDQWVAYCGPTAVANCLWWYDAVPEGWTPPQLIDTLARYFETNPDFGTDVYVMQAGLEQYFQDHGFALQESTFVMPDFYEMEDSLKRCQDIILLLGFWWYEEDPNQQFIRGDVNEDGIVNAADLTECVTGGPFSCDDAADVNDDGILSLDDCAYLSAFLDQGGPAPPPPFPACGTDPTEDELGCASFPPCPGEGHWWRESGHFVTMAGVCSDSLKIAISDPDNDGAVGGAPGRVRPPEHPQPGGYGPTLHNDPTFVSQDMYTSTLDPKLPSDGNPFWEINYPWPPVKYSGINVPDKFRAVTKPAPKGATLYATEVEFAVMICPKTTGVEEEGETAITPQDFELYQSYPNPFNNQTIIKYNLLKSCQVTLTIYNILGQKVKTLVKGYQEAGPKTMNWDGKDDKGKDLASGIYFYQLKAGKLTQTKRMVLLK